MCTSTSKALVFTPFNLTARSIDQVAPYKFTDANTCPIGKKCLSAKSLDTSLCFSYNTDKEMIAGCICNAGINRPLTQTDIDDYAKNIKMVSNEATYQQIMFDAQCVLGK